MKVPDKIYGKIVQNVVLDCSIQDNGGEKFIRKDVLLEWAKKEKEFIEGLFMEGDASFYEGQDDAYNNLIAKLQSL